MLQLLPKFGINVSPIFWTELNPENYRKLNICALEVEHVHAGMCCSRQQHGLSLSGVALCFLARLLLLLRRGQMQQQKRRLQLLFLLVLKLMLRSTTMPLNSEGCSDVATSAESAFMSSSNSSSWEHIQGKTCLSCKAQLDFATSTDNSHAKAIANALAKAVAAVSKPSTAAQLQTRKRQEGHRSNHHWAQLERRDKNQCSDCVQATKCLIK